MEERAVEALRHVACEAEPGAVRALALLARGEGGTHADAMLAADLPAIVDCHDCADFALVPLLWCRMRYAAHIGQPVRSAIDEAILGFRYWMDEPGNDVMWYFSENHALLFHTACYLAGAQFPDSVFRRSRRVGREQSEVGRRRLLDWFNHFEQHEMAEWNSAPYFPIDFKGLGALVALAPDAAIRERAGRAISRLLEIVAFSSHQGMLTASQGRSYEHSLRPCRTLELSAIARLFFGRGGSGARFHALPLLALLVRDHGFQPYPQLAELSSWRRDGALEWRFLQGPNGLAALYHHKTRDHAMGSIAAYRPGKWGYQETILHLRLGERPEAQIWINHPGERIVSGFGRPSYWGGCGTLPRVHQYRDLAVVDFDLQPGQVDFTHAWLPEAEFDEVRQEGRRPLLQEVEKGLRSSSAAIRSSGLSKVRAAAARSACRGCAPAGSRVCPISAARIAPRPSPAVLRVFMQRTIRTERFGLTTPTMAVSSAGRMVRSPPKGGCSILRHGPMRERRHCCRRDERFASFADTDRGRRDRTVREPDQRINGRTT